MILPFKGSPWRPIYISVLMCGCFGLLISGMGAVGLVSFALKGFKSAHINHLLLIAILSGYVAIGIVFFSCAYWLNRLRVAAVIVALSITSVGVLLSVVVFIETIAALLPDRRDGPFGWLVFLAFLLLELVLMTVEGVLIRSLVQSFGAIKILLSPGRRFEVVEIERDEDSRVIEPRPRK